MARQRKPPTRLPEGELYTYALKALAARARSAGEMRRLLSRRAIEAAGVDHVLERLAARGYLNDQRFSEALASMRLENQRFGRVRVLRELRARRVAADVAEQAVDAVYAEVDETHLLRGHLGRRLRGQPLPAEPNKLASLYRALRRAGFTHSTVLTELRHRKGHPEWLEKLQEEEESPLEPA
jgi:SOS response regulatory protein OraA/RecX